ncbi:MAG: hypothetical protein WCY27_03320 [archaeon]|jgi:hypothetical protein|nr:hypothetical protein [archaeon]MDD2478071.1 hypothetical protein [Candidatus ainarchaeum sp.]MDD3084943.1 hypothetical protein [Candidatus ainarchaeum sp.]MDD4221504.1 hypothetical protein [Candidatus ainarchaeum sp.]MDD4663022.1 hypothetical protein [Candidatus ainarchaeum sp.]
MVDKKLIQDTIIELLDANIDKNTIYSTLKDIGVDDGDIEKNYKEIINARNKKEEPEEPQESEEPHEKTITPKQENISKKETTKPKEDKIEEKYSKIEEPKIETKKDIIKDFNINEKDSQEDDLIETTSEVNTINEKEDEDIFNTQSKKEVTIPAKNTSAENEDVQEQLSDIKAQLKALTKIMKDILEENRNILNKL